MAEANETEAKICIRFRRSLWHYTTAQCFLGIIAEGVIEPATEYVPDGERPIVWFSLNQWWEETANKALEEPSGRIRRLSMRKNYEYGGGLVRFGVAPETAPHSFEELERLSGMPPEHARALRRVARRWHANPREWRGTFDPVPRSKWIAVEVFDGRQWVNVPFDPDPPVLNEEVEVLCPNEPESREDREAAGST